MRTCAVAGGLLGVLAIGCTPEQQQLAANVLQPGDLPAGEVDLVANLATLPGATLLGLGYDPSREVEFRNRVVELDFEVSRTAWASPEAGGLYYYAETDKRYLVPRHVAFLPQNQRSEVNYVISESKASFARELSAQLGVSGGYGMFSASIDASFDSTSSGERNSTFAQRSQRIYLWSLWLTPKVKLTPTFIARLEDLPRGGGPADQAAYDALIEDYGISSVSHVSLGGRLDYNQVISGSKAASTQDIKVSMSASYGSFFSAEGSVGSKSEEGSESSDAQTSVEVFGGNAAEAALLMESGGNPVPWSLSVPKDPAVIEVLVEDIWEHVEPGPVREGLRAAVYRRARRAHPSVQLDLSTQPDARIAVDGDEIEPPGVAPPKGAEALRIVVLDARNLEVRTNRIFQWIPTPSETSARTAVGILKAPNGSACPKCDSCGLYVETYIKERWDSTGQTTEELLDSRTADDVVSMLEKPDTNNSQRYFDERIDAPVCIDTLRRHLSTGKGRAIPDVSVARSLLESATPHDLVMLAATGVTGAHGLRMQLSPELARLGASRTQKRGPYLLFGNRGNRSHEVQEKAHALSGILNDQPEKSQYEFSLQASR